MLLLLLLISLRLISYAVFSFLLQTKTAILASDTEVLPENQVRCVLYLLPC